MDIGFLIVLTLITLFKSWGNFISRFSDKDRANKSHSQELALAILDEVYTIESNPAAFRAKDFRFANQNYFQIKKVSKEHAKNIGGTLGIKACGLFLKKITEAVKISDNDDCCYVWHPAIEDHKQNEHLDNCANILVNCLRDSLTGCLDNKRSDDVKDFVKDCLLKNKFYIVRRIGIYAVTEHYGNLKKLTDEILSFEDIFNPNYTHEYWHFLNKRFGSFSDDQKEQVLDTIEKIKLEGEYSDDEKPRACAYRKAQWYQAIKDSDERARQRHEECIGKGISEPIHPDFVTYTSILNVKHISPYSVDELAAMEVDELVKVIKEYDGPEDHVMDAPGFAEGPDLIGLCTELKETIKIDPQKYMRELDKWLDMKPYFIHALLSVYASLWNGKTEGLPWNKIWENVLEFCKNLVSRDDFWTHTSNGDNEKRFMADRNSVVKTIASLIESGVQDDKHVFDVSQIPLARETISKMLNKVEGGDYGNSSDALITAMNSPRGCCLEALIILALRGCRLADKEGKGHVGVWEKEYKSIFEDEFSIVESGKYYDFAPLAAKYLPCFLYMSKQWTLDNLNRFFLESEGHEIARMAAMHGYLYWGKLAPEIYSHLRDSGQFLRTLDSENLKKDFKDQIINQSVAAFLLDKETLEDEKGLLKQIFDRKKAEELSQIFWFLFLRREDDKNKKWRPKVFEIWKKAIEVLGFCQNKEVANKEYKKLASELCSLAVFIDKLDEEAKSLIMTVCRYAEVSWKSYVVTKMLVRLVDKYPDEAYEIYMEMLKKFAPFCKFTPFYPKNEINEMTQVLNGIKKYGSDGESKVKSIFDKYIEHGESPLVVELQSQVEENKNSQ